MNRAIIINGSRKGKRSFPFLETAEGTKSEIPPSRRRLALNTNRRRTPAVSSVPDQSSYNLPPSPRLYFIRRGGRPTRRGVRHTERGKSGRGAERPREAISLVIVREAARGSRPISFRSSVHKARRVSLLFSLSFFLRPFDRFDRTDPFPLERKRVFWGTGKGKFFESHMGKGGFYISLLTNIRFKLSIIKFNN